MEERYFFIWSSGVATELGSRLLVMIPMGVSGGEAPNI